MELEEQVKGEKETQEEESRISEEQPKLPPELEGLSEENAKAALEEAEVQREAQTSEEEEKPQERDAEVEELRAKVAEYEKRLKERAEVPKEKPPQQVRTRNRLQLTPQVVKNIKALAEARAQEMTGLTKEELSGLEYASEEDERVATYEYAKKVAERDIWATIREEEAKREEQEKEFYKQHLAGVESYNEFATKQMAKADFEQIKKFATGEYFNKLEPLDQLAVRGAYLRIEHQTAEPTDIALVKNYFRQAETEYRKSKGNIKGQTKKVAEPPKVDQLSAAAGSSGEISLSELERMLNTMPLEKIPQKYKEMLERG